MTLLEANEEINILNKRLKLKKDQVDNNIIYSETDMQGNITYVSKLFVEISGYSEDELIGSPHNLVRDPNTPKDTFQDMWNIIQKGGTWTGIITNKAKDGSKYTVKATVGPIYNIFGDISGYFSSRHDITKIIEQDEKILKLNDDLELKNQELLALTKALEDIVYNDDFDIDEFRKQAKKRHTNAEHLIESDAPLDLWIQ